MSASEQEIKSQVAEMRQALRSASAGRRAARVVNIFGVILGFCIVGFFVSRILLLGKEVISNTDKLQKAFMVHINSMQLDKKALQALKEAAPAYGDEARKLIADLKVPEKVSEQAQLMIKDLEPTFRAELERIRPRVLDMLNAQRDKTLKDLQTLLEKKVVDRVANLIGQQGEHLGTKLQITEQSVEKLLTSLRDASADAFTSMVQKRASELSTELERCIKVVAEIPPLPEAEQQVVIEDLMSVLAAYLKEELPPYTFQEGEFKAPPGVRSPATVTPEQVMKLDEKADKGREEAKKKAAEEATR